MTLRELPKEVLERGAIVYIRQSTGAQVHENLESQRRQYELVDLARRYGFRDVAVIDADLGRPASGTVDRPGFRDLVGRIYGLRMTLEAAGGMMGALFAASLLAVLSAAQVMAGCGMALLLYGAATTWMTRHEVARRMDGG